MSPRTHLVVALVAALACAGGSAYAGSYRREELLVEGVTRELFVYTPSTLAPGRSPAVLAFHGFLSDASGLRWIAKIDRFADAAGVIVIYPNAVAKSWNAGRGSGSTNRTTDDVAFAKALLAATLERPEVDPRRIYAMGFSNGAQMVATIVCKLDHQLAAAAMVAHSLNIPQCEPRARVPMLLIQGRKDPFVPFEGGGKDDLASHQFTVDFFRRINQAVAPAKNVLELESITCSESVDSAGREQVLSCIGERDGHTWPGGVVFQPELFGPTNSDLVGTEYVFSFFSRHVQPAPRRAASSGATTPAEAAAGELNKPEPSRWNERLVTLPTGGQRRYYEPREGLAGARVLVLVVSEVVGKPTRPDAVAAALGLTRLPGGAGYVIMDADLSGAVDLVVEQVRARVGAPLPVSVLGLGAGGAVAQQLFCDRSDLVSAVVMVAAAVKAPLCTPRPVPSLLSVQSPRDARAPADGDPKAGLMSQSELLATWRSDQGFPFDPDVRSGAGYSCRGGVHPDGEPEILTCRSDSTSAAAVGADAARIVGEFLLRHQAKPVPFTIVHPR